MIWYVLGFFLLLFVGIFLAGLASAWREIRAEKRAGVPVTRPGWERKPGSGLAATARGYWRGLRS